MQRPTFYFIFLALPINFTFSCASHQLNVSITRTPYEHMEMKECTHHADKCRRFRRRLVLWGAAGFVIVVLLVVLLVFLILRPSKPSFVLHDITVLALSCAANSSAPGGGAALTSSFQVTVAARNPNGLIGVYYDRLVAFAAYRGQQITLRTGLPAAYQGHREVVVWSPFVSGAAVPMGPYLAETLSEDQLAGTVLLSIRLQGNVRWRVSTWVSGNYRLLVNCQAFIPIGKREAGTPTPEGDGIKYDAEHGCTVVV